MEECVEQMRVLTSTYSSMSPSDVAQEHRKLVDVLKLSQIQSKLHKIDENPHPMFKFMRNYMEMIMILLLFIRATREGNWLLHLSSLDQMCKYFFANLNYARMVPQYLAEMYKLKDNDPEIWKELSSGNFCVNKTDVPFCSIGVDHGIEHINKMMKVKGGLGGITQKPAALSRFFLIAPELVRLSEELQCMANISQQHRTKHHELSEAIVLCQEQNIQKLKAVFAASNPFNDKSDHLINIVTKAVMPENIQHDILRSNDVGTEMYRTFVEERIIGPTNLWDRMTKVKLLDWTDGSKVVKVKLSTREIELKENRSLFARLLIIARSRTDIDLQEVIGEYEFSCLPRSLFSPDGSLLPSTDKSKLMSKLEAITESQQPVEEVVNTDVEKQVITRAIIIDAMAVVQELSGQAIKSCVELSKQFVHRIELKSRKYEIVHIVFDRYDTEHSLKEDTRNRRQRKSTRCCDYEISDSVKLTMPLKSFLGNSKNKDGLTVYLADKLLSHFKHDCKILVVANKDGAKSNHIDVNHLTSNQEEADTMLILHAIYAGQHADEVHIMSPDTDVFIIALQKFPSFNRNTILIVGTGEKRRLIHLEEVYNAIGKRLAEALPGFHAFTGSDTTGRICGKGKITCWNALRASSNDVLDAFSELGKTSMPSENVMKKWSMCTLFLKETKITEVSKVRWHLFKKKQAEAEKLPPTREALKQHILRAHYQAMVWHYSDVANPKLPPPAEYGWQEESGLLVPTISNLPPAPTAIVEFIKCACKTSKCGTGSCSCKRHGLTCTEMCACDADSEYCENTHDMLRPDSDNDDDDDENV